MESSEMFGGEECHSSESGWTMYLGSSINGDEQESCFDDDDDACRNPKNYYLQRDGEDSDDSMASDASSAPTHLHFNLKNGDVDDDEHEDGDSKYSKKQMETKNGRTSVKKMDEKQQVARSNTRKSQSFTAAQTDSKVKKSNRMGKSN